MGIEGTEMTDVVLACWIFVALVSATVLCDCVRFIARVEYGKYQLRRMKRLGIWGNAESVADAREREAKEMEAATRQQARVMFDEFHRLDREPWQEELS